MKEVVIVSACRTAIGAFGGTLRDALGSAVDVEATMTRLATRGRILALLMLRPSPRASSICTPTCTGAARRLAWIRTTWRDKVV